VQYFQSGMQGFRYIWCRAKINTYVTPQNYGCKYTVCYKGMGVSIQSVTEQLVQL